MTWPHGDDAPHPRILAICTANICRSPTVEHLLGAKLSQRGAACSMASAGFLFDGRSADQVMADLVRPSGIDLSAHSSTKITEELADSADLIVTMERRHAREIIVLAPNSAHRVHTLKGLVRATGAGSPAATLEDSLSAIAAQRSFSDLMGDGGPDEVPDPHKKAKRHYKTALQSLDQLTTDLTSWIASRTPTS